MSWPAYVDAFGLIRIVALLDLALAAGILADVWRTSGARYRYLARRQDLAYVRRRELARALAGRRYSAGVRRRR